MSGIPSISWPDAHANQTYIALGIEMPIVGIVGSDPELIFLGAESYLLFMQEGMSMNAYKHLNISDNLLSSTIDPLVSFDEPSGIFSESPFSSSAVSDDLRLLAVLLYQSDNTQQGQSSSASMASSSSSSSSTVDLLSEIDDFLSGETMETRGEFNWNAWANDMNANPLLRMNFDISDFAAKAGLGTPVAAEVLTVKDDVELTDSLDVEGGWDVVSTLYQTRAGSGNNAAGTATTALGPAAASGMGAAATGARGGSSPGLGLMPSGAGAGSAMNPSSGAGSAGSGAVATGSPLTSTGPDESGSDSDDGTSGAEPAGAPGSSGSSSAAGGSPNNMNPNPSGSSEPGGIVVVPVASSDTALGAASTGRPLTSTGEPDGSSSSSGADGSDDDDSCGDDDDDDDDGSDGSGAGVGGSGPTGAGSVVGASGVPQKPGYSVPQYSGAAGGIPSLLNATAAGSQANSGAAAAATGTTTPTESAARAGITGSSNGKADSGQVTIDIDIGDEFATVRGGPRLFFPIHIRYNNPLTTQNQNRQSPQT